MIGDSTFIEAFPPGPRQSRKDTASSQACCRPHGMPPLSTWRLEARDHCCHRIIATNATRYISQQPCVPASTTKRPTDTPIGRPWQQSAGPPGHPQLHIRPQQSCTTPLTTHNRVLMATFPLSCLDVSHSYSMAAPVTVLRCPLPQALKHAPSNKPTHPATLHHAPRRLALHFAVPKACTRAFAPAHTLSHT